MTTMYRVDKSYMMARIERVEVTRKTQHRVWYGEECVARISSWRAHFDTWEEAHDWLLKDAMMYRDNCEIRLHQAQENLERAEKTIAYIEAMKEPEKHEAAKI